jgi:outer membrane usher protein FimD/PapC
MKCLDDAQVQALVDDEAADDVRAHAASCAGCAARLEKRRMAIDAALLALDIPAPMASMLQRRVEQAVMSSAPRGATRLRVPAAGAVLPGAAPRSR